MRSLTTKKGGYLLLKSPRLSTLFISKRNIKQQMKTRYNSQHPILQATTMPIIRLAYNRTHILALKSANLGNLIIANNGSTNTQTRAPMLIHVNQL